AHQRLEWCQGRCLEESDLTITGNPVERSLGPVHPYDDSASAQRSDEDGIAYLELPCHNISLSCGGQRVSFVRFSSISHAKLDGLGLPPVSRALSDTLP